MPDHPWRSATTRSPGPTAFPDLERVFATIKEAGWEGVELLDNDANWSGPPSRVRGMLERVGLPAVAMLGVRPDRRCAHERGNSSSQKRLIDFGAELGCEAYVFLGGDRVSAGSRATTTSAPARRRRQRSSSSTPSRWA